MKDKQISIKGYIKQRMYSIEKNWLLPARSANPFMLEQIAQRDKHWHKKLLPWNGEFVGKHLTSLYYFFDLTKSAKIKKEIDIIVDSLDAFGEYLGVFNEKQRFIHTYENYEKKLENTWDCWSHYHIMFALYLLRDNIKAEKILLKVADYICDFFLANSIDFSRCGSLDINQALLHIYALLSRRYSAKKYEDMVSYLIKFNLTDAGGNMLGDSILGKEFYMLKYPRWETLHTAAGYLELYRNYGENKYLIAVEKIIFSILKFDVHNTGGFSSGEQAVGDPFNLSPIETCCTVAFCELCANYLQIKPSVAIADYLEVALYNASLGSFHSSGRWSTYNTPMIGVKRASQDEIGFQCGHASPELNCCSVNAPKGIGVVSEWAAVAYDKNVYLNYFGASIIEIEGLKIAIEGRFPKCGQVKICVEGNGKLFMRIPSYATHTKIRVDKGGVMHPTAGEYFELNVCGRSVINIDFNFHFNLSRGANGLEGYSSIYYGPVLLALDLKYNTEEAFSRAELELGKLTKSRETSGCSLFMFESDDIILNDFASAGDFGTPYTTWLKIK